MKILILSAYTNSKLRSFVRIKEYNRVIKFLIRKLGLEDRTKLKDIAPWVGDFIVELEQKSDVELFSVSPQIKMKKKIESFKYKKTNYFFYSQDYSSALRLLNSYQLWKRLQTCSNSVRTIVKKVNPDIIILFGTENLTVSAPVLSLTDYPVFCILQTVYHKPDRSKFSRLNNMIMQLENEILQNVKFYGTSSKEYSNLLKRINPNISVMNYYWISSSLPALEIQQKKYDFVNFAFTMDKRKGDEDSIRALAIVKKNYPHVTLSIAGGISSERKIYIKELVKELDLEENVFFTPLFEQKEDMYRHVLQARYALLPVKLDLVSTTTREAMFYSIPVITNITSETPFLNKDDQCVLLAEKENIDSLAQCMLELMENEQLAKTLSENGHNYMVRQMNNTSKVDRLMNILNSIIAFYCEGKSIPEDLLLDSN